MIPLISCDMGSFMHTRRTDLNIEEIRRRNCERNRTYRARIAERKQLAYTSAPSREEFEALKREVADHRNLLSMLIPTQTSPPPSTTAPLPISLFVHAPPTTTSAINTTVSTTLSL